MGKIAKPYFTKKPKVDVLSSKFSECTSPQAPRCSDRLLCPCTSAPVRMRSLVLILVVGGALPAYIHADLTALYA